MYHTGVDTHKVHSYFQHMDDDGALGLSMSLPTNAKGIDLFLDKLDAPTTITLEAGRNYWWLHEYFANHKNVSDVYVVDPRRSRQIAKELSVISGYGRAKNDRIDGEMLADQTRRGLAPTIHVPTAEQLELRSVCRFRTVTVHHRTQAKNYIHAVLAMQGKSISIKKLMDESDAKQKLYDVLPNYVPIIVDHLITRVQLLNRQIASLDSELGRLLPASDPQMKLLLTVPGIGPIMSRIILSEILDIGYFKAPKYLISYSGLAPIDNTSAGRQGPMKLNNFSNHFLKYAFVEAAHNASDNQKYWKKYELDTSKHGKIIAKLNLARRLAKTVYWMLTRQQPYKL